MGSSSTVRPAPRRRIPTIVACALLVASLLAIPPGPAPVDPPDGGMSAAAVAAMVSSYGDTGGHWAGGDGSVSVLLPDGRVAWLFSDTFVGAVNPDHSLPAATGLVNNSIVLQDGGRFVATVTGGTAGSPAAVVSPGVAGEFYWVGDAVVEDGTLQAIYNRYRLGGSGPLDVVHLGSALVTFSLPELSLSSVVPLGYGTAVAWGSSIVSANGYTYIYGTEAVAATTKFAHVARVPAGGLGGVWSFWSGSAWTSDPATSARVLSGVGDSFGVQVVDGEFVLVTMESQLVFDAQIVAYTATSPTGPFAGPIDLFTAPDPAAAAGRPLIAYNAQVHPELARAGRLLVSYDLNSLNIADVRADIRRYRPRFVEVRWPRRQPDPANLPATPTALTASTNSAGTVHLDWQAPAGLSFHVYQRDVTAGHLRFARSFTTGRTSADVGLLLTGRTYEFRVAAVNAAGEGPPSSTVIQSIVIAAPPAPTGLVAVADAAGHITLSWTPVAGAWKYAVYRRDVSTGDSGFSLLVPATTTTVATVDLLEHRHVYEFAVTATHGGGTSPMSVVAAATAFYPPPAAPSGLAASPTDGGVVLTWTASSTPDAWYNVYRRDVTAGESAFTRLPVPATTCCTLTGGLLTNGHTYEFKLSALSAGGESLATSNTVSVTPR